MYLRYDDLIAETPAALLDLERKHRHSPLAARIKMLRLLKSGLYRSRRALVEVIGYSERQLHRWFETYRNDGLDVLLTYEQPPGPSERLTPEAWDALDAEMKEGRIGRLEDARAFLAEYHNIDYSLAGLSVLFQRRKVKLKTGRPRHVKASAEEQEAFLKTVR
jgi:transposase